MTTTYETLEQIRALDNGHGVAVETGTSGRPAEFVKAEDGLMRDGATLPWSLFTGAVKAGMIKDNHRPDPQPDQWWQNGRWWFYITARDDDKLSYILWTNETVHTWFGQSTATDFLTRRSRNKVDSSVVPESLRDPMLLQLVKRYHESARYAQSLESMKIVTDGTFQARLTQVANELEAPLLDSALASVGWGRPRNLPVQVTITGSCFVEGPDMATFLGDSDLTITRSLLAFTKVVTIEIPIEKGTECLCRRDYSDKVREHFPPNTYTATTRSRCTNH